MNSILVILITGMAVLGAYYLAELLTEGLEKPKQNEAVLILPQPADASCVWETAVMVRRILPRCQVIAAGKGTADQPMPCSGMRGVRILAGDALENAVLQELHLQSGIQDL